MKKRKWGPGMLVTAAFIGPGTVTLASTCGAQFGYALLWVVVFSVLAAIVFQEMAARLGVVTGEDLSVALRNSSRSAWVRFLVVGLVVLAVLIGNAAYQAGNIAGATTGLETLTGVSMKIWALVIAVVAAIVLWIGRLPLVQNVLIVLVAFMSVLFVLSAIVVGPDWSAVGRGIAVPQIPANALMVVVGLLGTTVVPYNLFLHSRSAVETWHRDDATDEQVARAVREARNDTILAIGLGGLITMSILITAAAAFFAKGITLGNLTDIAAQLRPVLGGTSEFVFCLGLTAAGLTSAITAPLAAGFVAAGSFGWGRSLADPRTRAVMMTIIAIGVGVIFFAEGKSPTQIIVIAQVANGLILPFVAIFLLWVMNRSPKLKSFRNSKVANVLAVFVIIVVSLLAWRQMDKATGTVKGWFAVQEQPMEDGKNSD